ncbi:MAG: CPBP family intramembrane glutamic endopeptidase [Anaerolineaceae bacterium]
MKNNRLQAAWWGERVFLAVIFAALGLLIYSVFSPYDPQFPPIPDFLGRIGLSVFLFCAAWLAHRVAALQKYASLLFGFGVMIAAVSLDWVFANFLTDSLHLDGNSMTGIAWMKLSDGVVIITTIVVLTRLSGESLGSIYIQKGKLKTGLLIGGVLFCLAAAGSIFMASSPVFSTRGDLTLQRILPWTPWVLIFALANGAQEEILFRGLFLRKLEPFFGKFFSVFLIALVFTVLHSVVNYTPNMLMFLAIVFPLALVWGWLMLKTEGVWASILFHAGMDIPIILSIYSNL